MLDHHSSFSHNYSMKIADIFSHKKCTFSFEFFPPKTPQGDENLIQTIRELKTFNPDFVSVTYGAMGTTREKTIALSAAIQNEIGITAMAHLTCVGSTVADIDQILHRLKADNIENIMALRGDPPQGQEHFVVTDDKLRHGSDLIGRIKEFGGFCVGGAGYPEGHIEAETPERDWEFLKLKMDQGADFIVTQLFLDNSHYFRFREEALRKGVTLRLIPGIMPVTNYEQIHKFTAMCGCRIPAALQKRLEPIKEDKEAVIQVGIDHAIDQCAELLAAGAPGLHFYTLNKSSATRDIFQVLRENGCLQGAG